MEILFPPSGQKSDLFPMDTILNVGVKSMVEM
jgi:hypothetical protein